MGCSHLQKSHPPYSERQRVDYGVRKYGWHVPHLNRSIGSACHSMNSTLSYILISLTPVQWCCDEFLGFLPFLDKNIWDAERLSLSKAIWIDKTWNQPFLLKILFVSGKNSNLVDDCSHTTVTLAFKCFTVHCPSTWHCHIWLSLQTHIIERTCHPMTSVL